MHLLLGPGLLTTEGAQHRRQRKMLNPVFSAAHLRNMTHIFYDIARKASAPLRLPRGTVTDGFLRFGARSLVASERKHRRSTSTAGWRARPSRCWGKPGSGTPSTTSLKTRQTHTASQNILQVAGTLVGSGIESLGLEVCRRAGDGLKQRRIIGGGSHNFVEE